MSEYSNIMNTDHTHLQALVIGAIAGGLIGTASIIFLDQKNKKNLRRNFRNIYENITDKACEIKDNLSQQSEDLIEKAQKISHLSLKNVSNTQLMIAGLALGILAGSIAYTITKSGRRSDFENCLIPINFEKKAEPWLKNAKIILNSIGQAFEKKETKTEETGGAKLHEAQSHMVDDFFNLVNTGIHIYQSIKSSRH